MSTLFYIGGLVVIWHFWEEHYKEIEKREKTAANERLELVKVEITQMDEDLANCTNESIKLQEQLEQARIDNEALYRTLTKLYTTMKTQK